MSDAGDPTTQVRIEPDFTGFASALAAGVDAAIDQLAGRVTAGLRPVEQQAAASGRRIASELNKGAASGAKSLREVGSTAEKEAARVGTAAGRAGSKIASEVGAGARAASNQIADRLHEGVRDAAEGMSAPLREGGAAAGEQAGAAFSDTFSQRASEGAQNASRSVAMAMSGAGLVAGGLLATSLATGFQRFTTIQDAQASMKVILGDAMQADKLMAGVLDTVKGTPFNLDQFADAARTLVAFNIDAAKVPGILDAIGESAAASGRGAEAVGSLVDVFGQMAATGRVDLESVWSISASGVNALAILGNEFGVTTEVMRDMISEGTVPAERAIDALTKGIIEGSDGASGHVRGLGGTMEALRGTVSGAFGGFKAAMARLGAGLLAPVLTQAPRLINATSDALDKITKQLGSMMSEVANSDTASGVITGIAKAIEGLTSDDVANGIDKLGEIAPFIAAAGAALATLAGGQLPFIGQLFTVFSPAQAAVLAFALAVPEVRTALVDLGRDLAPLVMELARRLMPVLENLGDIAASVLPAGIRLFGAALHAVLVIVLPLADAVAALTGFLAEHSEAVAAAAGAYVTLKVAAAASAFLDGSRWAAVTNGIMGSVSALYRFRAAVQVQAAATGVSQIGTAFQMLATSSMSAGAIAAGAVAGIAAGAAYAEGVLNRTQKQSEAFAAKFVEGLDHDPKSIRDTAAAVSDINDQIQGLTDTVNQPEWVRVAQDMNPFADNTVERAARDTIELANQADKLSKQLHNLVGNYDKVAEATGLEQSEVEKLAHTYGIDLTGSVGKSEDARNQLIGSIQQMQSDAKAAGIAIETAMTLDPDKLKADAEAVQQIMSGTANTMAGFLDVLQLKDEPVDPKQLRDARDRVAEAERAVRDAEKSQRDVRTEAAGSLRDTKDEARTRREIADKQQEAADRLIDAQRGLRDAREALADTEAKDSPLDGKKIADFYAERITQASKFNEEIKTAISMGLSPDLVARMLTQGPEQAGPLLEQIVADTSGGMVKLVNAAEAQISEMSASTVRIAQLTQQAINLGTQQAAEDLNKAVVIAQQAMTSPADASLNELAKQLGISVDRYKEIAEEFQIDISKFTPDTSTVLRNEALNRPFDRNSEDFGVDSVKKAFTAYVASNEDVLAWLKGEDLAGQQKLLAQLFQNFTNERPDLAKELATGGSEIAFSLDGSGGLLDSVRQALGTLNPDLTVAAVADEGALEDTRAKLDDLTKERTITITIDGKFKTRKTSIPADFLAWIAPSIHLDDRWGGVNEVARWGRVPPLHAHVTKNPSILYGERETGGEAMIPRLGNLARSEQIARVAAGWLGGVFVSAAELAQTPRFAMALGGVTSTIADPAMANMRAGSVFEDLSGTVTATTTRIDSGISIGQIIVKGGRGGARGAMDVVRGIKRRRWLGTPGPPWEGGE